MDEFRALLDRFWIRREEDRELFYRVRRKLPALRRALREQFGWEVICTEQVIRLESGTPIEWSSTWLSPGQSVEGDVVQPD